MGKSGQSSRACSVVAISAAHISREPTKDSSSILSDLDAALLQVPYAQEDPDHNRDQARRKKGIPRQVARFVELSPERQSQKEPDPEHDLRNIGLRL